MEPLGTEGWILEPWSPLRHRTAPCLRSPCKSQPHPRLLTRRVGLNPPSDGWAVANHAGILVDVHSMAGVCVHCPPLALRFTSLDVHNPPHCTVTILLLLHVLIQSGYRHLLIDYPHFLDSPTTLPFSVTFYAAYLPASASTR